MAPPRVQLGDPPRRWTVLRRRLRVNNGLCDYADRVIILAHTLHGRKLLEITNHEGLHACLPDLSEEAVVRVAKQLTRLQIAAIPDLADFLHTPPKP